MLSEQISNQIKGNFSFTPTKDQLSLINLLGAYVADSRTSDILIINGYAGTGKSTIIAALTATLKAQNLKSYMLAPTGRAAKIMSNYANEGAITIHKKIYRQKSITEDKFVLDFNRDKGSYYIIDEASMIGNSSGFESSSFGSGNLLDDLIQYIEMGTDCRLIIVGDSAQLPPIGTILSPALDVNYMSRYGRIFYHTMSEVVRQAELSGILANATICREIIESGIPEIPKFDLNFPDVKNITGGEFLEELEDAYGKYGRESCIVITRSNKQAGRFNQGIRGRILYQEEEFSSGDLVMIVKNNYAYAQKRVENGVEKIDDNDFIANGDVALVRRVRKYEEVHSLRFAEATLWLGSDEERELECKVILNTLGSDSPALSKDDSTKLLKSVEEDYLSFTRKNERYKEMKKDPYLNALQIKFAYAITCHKSQGGEWDVVFIDRMLFGDEQINIDLLRWLYTAITRASKKLFFINFEDRFFAE